MYPSRVEIDITDPPGFDIWVYEDATDLVGTLYTANNAEELMGFLAHVYPYGPHSAEPEMKMTVRWHGIDCFEKEERIFEGKGATWEIRPGNLVCAYGHKSCLLVPIDRLISIETEELT